MQHETKAPRTYQERLEANLCTRPGCNERPGDSNECPRHHADSLARARRYRRRRRRIWAKKKLCMRCGGTRRKGSKWCNACLIKAGRLRIADHHKQQHNTPRMTTTVEADGYARTRYRGQGKRGQQKRWQLDLQDLDDAIERLQRAKAGVLATRDAEEALTPRVQLAEIRNAAMSQAAHARRFVEDVLRRNRYRELDDELLDDYPEEIGDSEG